MDATDLRGLIWSALRREGLVIVPAGLWDDPSVRALIVDQVGQPALLVIVGELRDRAAVHDEERSATVHGDDV